MSIPMNVARIMTGFFFLYSFTLWGCGAKKKLSADASTVNEGSPPVPNGQTPPKNLTINLSVRALSIPPEVTFPWYESNLWTTEESYVFSHPNGATASINPMQSFRDFISNKPHPSSDFKVYFKFSPSSWLSSDKTGRTQYVAKDPNIMLEHKIETEGVAFIHATPTGLIYKKGDTTFLEKYDDGKLATLKIGSDPWLSSSMGACRAGCDVWSFRDQKLYVGRLVESKLLWETFELSIAGADSPLDRVFLAIERSSDQRVQISDLLAVTKDQKALILDKNQSSSTTSRLMWPELQKISDLYCLDCHRADGFDREETWVTLRDELLIRLKNPGPGKTPMPPPNTTQGRDMPLAAKKAMIVYVDGLSRGSGD